MARRFVAVSSQYFEYAGAIATATPITMVSWIRLFTAATGSVFGLCNSSTTHRLGMDTQLGAIRATATGPTANGSATVAIVQPIGIWAHGTAKLSSNTSRDAFLNGGNKVSNATDTGTPAGINVTDIAVRHLAAAFSNFENGDIAHCAAWNTALSDTEIYAQSRGWLPTMTQPTALLAWWKLDGTTGQEINYRGRQFLMIPTAAPMPSPSPLIYTPRNAFLNLGLKSTISGFLSRLALLGVG